MRISPICFALLYGAGIFAAEDGNCIEYTNLRRLKNTRYLERCKTDIKTLSISCESDKSQLRTVVEYGSLEDLARAYLQRLATHKRQSTYFKNKRTSYQDNFFDAQNRHIRTVHHMEGIEDLVMEYESWDVKGRPLRAVAKKPVRCGTQEAVYHYDDQSGEATAFIRGRDPGCSGPRVLNTYKMSGNDLEFAKYEINGEVVAFDRYETLSREKICFPKP